jgi:hypothetical protein
MPSPVLYVREYAARKAPFHMVAPWRHSDRRVRAHYWAGEVRAASAELDGLGREPSHERDIAYDRMCNCLDHFREAVADWRQTHRLFVPSKSEPRFNTSTKAA